MFVSGIVVKHGVDQLASRDLALDGIEKADEFATSDEEHYALHHAKAQAQGQ